MSGLCLVAGLLVAPLGEAITLRWTHSIQKTVWEEDWHREDDTLALVEARIQGTGAGMEPPENAVLKDGAWHYRPALPPLPRLALRHSPYVPPYLACNAAGCKPLPDWLPGLPAETVVELAPCPHR